MGGLLHHDIPALGEPHAVPRRVSVFVTDVQEFQRLWFVHEGLHLG